MSIVVGLKYKKEIYMGADSIGVSPDGDRRPVKYRKIIRNGNFLIGYTGSVRTGQVLSEAFFTTPEDLLDLPSYMIDVFNEHGCLKTSENGGWEMNSNLLIAWDGHLFEMLQDFQLNEVDGSYSAVGTGASVAFGAFFATEKMGLEPRKRINIALNAACEFIRSCGPPFNIERL